MSEKDLRIIILAAGKGTRMKSDLPKVLHPVCGIPMVKHVVAVANRVSQRKPLVVIGYKAEMVSTALGEGIDYVLQEEQLGTGHAIMMAAPQLQGFSGDLLVLYGDTPLITAETLTKLVVEHQRVKSSVTLLSVEVENPAGYGRIIRDKNGDLERIVEEKDASPEEKKVKEVNTGIYIFNYQDLAETLTRIKPKNAQDEYYLTDVVELLAAEGKKAWAVPCENAQELLGPNDRKTLAETDRIMRRRILDGLMMEGVTIIDPATTYIEPQVEIGPDTIIYPGTFLQGETKIGVGCQIGPYSQLRDSQIGDASQVRFSVLDHAKTGEGVNIGPYSFLRPGTVVEKNGKVGGFVETKNTQIGEGSKVPHLSYIGDCLIGTGVNIGAGTITCNYDGYAKHETVIGDGAFIGSNTNLVAPVLVGKGALVGAGSTITKDVPEDGLALARAKQIIKEKWVQRRKG